MNFVKNLLGMGNTIEKVIDSGANVAKTFSNKEQGTRRLQMDMLSDTPLSKNIRPIIVIWILTLFTGMLIAKICGVAFDPEFKETIFWILIAAIGFYFPGRTIEKWVKTRK